MIKKGMQVFYFSDVNKRNLLPLFLLFFIVNCKTSLYGQTERWIYYDTSSVTLESAEKLPIYQSTLYQKFDLEPKLFTMYGITVPAIMSGTIGFPHTRIDISYFRYRQRKQNFATTVVFNFGNVYDLYHMDIPNLPLSSEFRLSFIKYKNPQVFYPKKAQRMTIGYGSGVYYQVEQRAPMTRQLGFSYGYLASSQVSVEGVPFFSQGIQIGLMSRRFVKFEARLADSQPKHTRYNRSFYSNILFPVMNYGYYPITYKGKSREIQDAAKIPFGFCLGWYFMYESEDVMKKYQDTWNIELGIKGPIFIETFSNTDRAWPMFYFSYRLYLGAYKIRS